MRQLRVGPVQDRYAAEFHLVAQEQKRLANDIVKRQNGALRRLARSHPVNTRHDVRGPPRIRGHIFDCAADLGHVGNRPVQPAQTGSGVGRDGGQRLVDFVRDGGGELAEHRDACRMRELRLHLPKPLLGADALRDVDRGDQAYFEIIDWADAGRGEENVDDAAVPRHHLGFFLEVRFTAKAGLHGPPKRIRACLPGVGHGTPDIAVDASSEHLDGPFVGFLKRERVHAGPEKVGMAVEIAAEVLDALGSQFSEQHHQSAGVELTEGDRHAAEQVAVALLAPLQLGVVLLLGGDIHDRADEPKLSALFRRSTGDHANVPDRAIAQDQPMFQGKVVPVVRGAIERLAYGIEIVGMRTLQDGVERRRQGRLEIEDPERLFGPEQLAAGDVPAKAAGVAELLGLGEIGDLTPPQDVLSLEPVLPPDQAGDRKQRQHDNDGQQGEGAGGEVDPEQEASE